MRSLIAIAGLLLVTGCGTSPDTTTPAAEPPTPTQAPADTFCADLAGVESDIDTIDAYPATEQAGWYDDVQALAHQGVATEHSVIAEHSSEILEYSNSPLGRLNISLKLQLLELKCADLD